MQRAKYFRLLAMAVAAYGLIAVKPMRAAAAPWTPAVTTAEEPLDQMFGSCPYNGQTATIYSASGWTVNGTTVLSGDVCDLNFSSQSTVSVLN